MSELKQQYPSSFEKSKGVISEPSNFYRGDSVTFNTTHGELIVIASDVNAIRYASECMMPSYFKVDIARAQDVVVFAHSKVVRQDKPQGEWISVESYRDIPVGTWQVATEARGSRDAETHIATVEKNVTIIGNCFAFDLPRVYAYAPALPAPPKQ